MLSPRELSPIGFSVKSLHRDDVGIKSLHRDDVGMSIVSRDKARE